MPAQRILVTGASGALGASITRALRQRGHQVRGFDQAPSHQAGDHHLGDLMDFDAVHAATEGIDVVVHFGAVPDRDDFTHRLVPTNIVGTYHVFEAARMRGIGRVVYASSCRVLGALDWSKETLALEHGFAPADHYAVTKATGELLGQLYSHRYGIQVLCARIGWFVRNRNEAAKMDTAEVGQRMYLSHRDAERFFELAVSVDLPPFAAVFVTSKNAGRPLGDPEPAQRVMGFEARDTWPEGSNWDDAVFFESPHGASSLLPDRAP